MYNLKRGAAVCGYRWDSGRYPLANWGYVPPSESRYPIQYTTHKPKEVGSTRNTPTADGGRGARVTAAATRTRKQTRALTTLRR